MSAIDETHVVLVKGASEVAPACPDSIPTNKSDTPPETKSRSISVCSQHESIQLFPVGSNNGSKADTASVSSGSGEPDRGNSPKSNSLEAKTGIAESTESISGKSENIASVKADMPDKKPVEPASEDLVSTKNKQPTGGDTDSILVKSESSDKKQDTQIVCSKHTTPVLAAFQDFERRTDMAEAPGSDGEKLAPVTESIDAELTDAKYVDQFDTENKGDVVGYYFTRFTRSRALSPIKENQDQNFQFAAHSDLYVKVKGRNGGNFVFEVDSSALASHSPVFFDMAYKTDLRGNQEEWVWELESDSIHGLAVLFSLLHLDLCQPMFNKKPQPGEVYDVLRVFSKYKIPKSAFFPWVQSWTAGFRDGLDSTKLSRIECLYVAYELADFQSLKRCIRQVAHEVELNSGARLGGRLIEDIGPITKNIVDEIQTVRTADLESLLKPLQEAYAFFMDPNNADDNKFCRSVDAHRQCNQMLLGTLLTNLVQQQMFPVPAPDSYRGDVRSLARKISEMDVRGLYLPGLEPHKQRHGLCRLGQDFLAKKISNNESYIPLSKHLVKQMYQAAKSQGVQKIEKAEFQPYGHLFFKGKEGEGDDSWMSDEDSGVFDQDSVPTAQKASQ